MVLADLEGDPNGPDSEWNETHFDLVIKRFTHVKHLVSMV